MRNAGGCHIRSKTILKRFGIRLRELRKDRGFSQEELAARAGLDRTFVGSCERALRNLSLVNICKLAKALETPVADLMNFKI